MQKSDIIVPGLHRSRGQAHAMCIDDTVLTSCLAAVDRNGRLLAQDAEAQATCIYEQLDQILRSAGVAWKYVAQICHYVSPDISPIAYDLIERCLDRFLPERSCAISTACLGAGVAGSVIQIELAAHIGMEPRPLVTHGQRFPAGVRAGRHVYLASRSAAERSSLAEETRQIYSCFGQLLSHAGCDWIHATRVRQYLASDDADFNDVREGRKSCLSSGRCLSTSVAALPLAHQKSQPLICIDLEAIIASKVTLNTSAVQDTPGVPHALRAGNLVHLQAQIADDKGNILFPGDIEGQATYIFGNLTEMLSAAGLDWRHVIKSRVYCRDVHHLQEVRRIEREWAGTERFAQTDLVARFFDPEVLVEIEITAHRRVIA